MTLTVLYDESCGICRTARRFLDSRAQLVPLEFVAAGSDEARRRYPTLDHAQTLKEITVIGDDGAIYVDDSAWLRWPNFPPSRPRLRRDPP
jgi:predicted DCC family thiol-disulfide oxidoreductase YuxK